MNRYQLKMAGFENVLSGMEIRTIVITPSKAIRADNDLITDALGGNLAAFKELVERYYKPAYCYARGMTHNSDDAYDLSQEAFVRVHKHLRRFDPKYPFKVWLFHILANLCKNHLRQKRTRDKVFVTSEEASTYDAVETVEPDAGLYQSEIQKQVWNAIVELPEKFKEVIILSHFQDMSYDQIAQALEIPRGSVMSRLYYARLKLREILEKRGVEL